MSDFDIRLSPLDTARFGIPSAKADAVTSTNIADINGFCQKENIRFLIARASANNLDAVQAMEANGFRLMDTLVYYAFKYAKNSIPQDKNQFAVRSMIDADIEPVRTMAEASFEGYFGHYHADPRLDKASCDAVYTDWAANSVQSRDVADTVLIVHDTSDAYLGFATLRMNNPDEGEGVLFGVAPQAQGQGIYRTMMIHGMQWVQAQGASRMVVSTQITNIAVQKVWARLGFEMDRAYYTLHKWYDT